MGLLQRIANYIHEREPGYPHTRRPKAGETWIEKVGDWEPPRKIQIVSVGEMGVQYRWERDLDDSSAMFAPPSPPCSMFWRQFMETFELSAV